MLLHATGLHSTPPPELSFCGASRARPNPPLSVYTSFRRFFQSPSKKRAFLLSQSKGKIAIWDILATEPQFLERSNAIRLSFAIRPCLRCVEDSNAAQLQCALRKRRSEGGCSRVTNVGRRWGRRRPSGSGLCVAIGASSRAERLICLGQFHFQNHS